MAAPTDRVTPESKLLAALVKQRRVTLKFVSKERAAEASGLSHMPYRNVEAGRPVSDTTYTKIEAAFGMVAGSCQAVLDGADSIRLTDGSELIRDGHIRRPSLENVDAEARAAIQTAVGLTTPDMTVGQAERLTERALEELRRRGIIPASASS